MYRSFSFLCKVIIVIIRVIALYVPMFLPAAWQVGRRAVAMPMARRAAKQRITRVFFIVELVYPFSSKMLVYFSLLDDVCVSCDCYGVCIERRVTVYLGAID